ncbi:hypothetical protein Dsin_006720 [Dipteronia sinensis]|uniref:Reverse transcriptase zinc-binding domain-containing protein n=1 Tax=Dipteronia sinensis TaxID=43782 RepID=A0AAE0AYW0_9ROSI|nr:hypothetical protein Dsin_006720 [Dipteronia sinensis]
MVVSPASMDANATVDTLRTQSGLSLSESWWKFLCRIQVPAKVKLFHNGIPTNSNLAKRGVLVDSLCLICRRRSESTMHSYWCCPALKVIRAGCPFMRGIKVNDNFDFIDFMLLCRDKLAKADLELLCLLLWRLWHRRNCSVHGSTSLPYTDIIPWSESFLSDFRNANSGGIPSAGVSKMAAPS